MKIEDLRLQWETFGKGDPMRAVLTDFAGQDHSWDPADFLATGRQDIDRIMKSLEARQITVPRTAALDFGCGVGRLTQGLAQYFDEATGVDISQPMLSAANAHNAFPDRVRFVRNVATNLSVFPDRSFDFVFTHIVLQHLEPHLAVGYLAEFMRVVRPGGLVVFQIPTQRVKRRLRYALVRAFPRPARALRRMRFGAGLPATEMHVIPHETIAQLVSRNGGEILAIDRDEAAGENFVSSIYTVRKK